MIKYQEPDEYGRPITIIITEETAIARTNMVVLLKRGKEWMLENYNDKLALEDFITVHYAEKCE